MTQSKLSDLAEWSAAGLLPELMPAKQQRSMTSAMDMLHAGKQLLEKGTLEDLSIEAVCELAGTTTGTFYGRFVSKNNFFRTLQRVALLPAEQKLDELLERHSAGDVDSHEMFSEVIALMVEVYRDNTGVLRASLQHTSEGMFTPIKSSGDKFRRALANALTSTIHADSEQGEVRAKFAYQVVVGVLVQATLNNPGPLSLDSAQLAPELKKVLVPYLWPEA